MTDPDLSAIFNRHAFDPWLPESRGRDCSVVMDKAAFLAAVAEFGQQQKGLAKHEHGCRCSECDHYWQTRDYPSTCPKCGKMW